MADNTALEPNFQSLLAAYVPLLNRGEESKNPLQIVQIVPLENDTESVLSLHNSQTLDDYLWMVVVGGFVSFFVAFGIGANDVANAFATSVGSGAISIGEALVVAAIFEFLGAFFLGAHVTDTVRKKIARQEYFYDQPEVFMYGNLCALTATGIWLLFASYMELPVSTTHSITGGVVGFAIVVDPDAVLWSAGQKDFPYFKGISSVVTSWFVSPILSAVLAALLFFTVRLLVLRSEHSYERAFLFFPVLVFLTVFINVLFILTKGASGLKRVKKLQLWKSMVISLGCGAVVGVATAIFSFSLKSRLDAYFEGRADKPGVRHKSKEERSVIEKLLAVIFRGVDVDVHEVVETNHVVSSIHEHQEKFDVKTEEAFKYLQVFTAICDSFSHGANDVANSIGPFAAIVKTYQKGRINNKAKVDDWILAFGGVGIVIGLGTYGYNIMRAIGVKLIAVTPSRGFAIELGAAVVIALGSYFGLPLSTTHCQVGAEIGVGLLEGHLGVNWTLLARILVGWVITLVVVGLMSGLLFSFGAFAPSIQQSRQIVLWREWAGGFAEGVRQAYITNNDDGETALPFVEYKGQEIVLKTDNTTFPVSGPEGDKSDDEWPNILPNQLELLTNVHLGFQTAKVQQFTDFYTDPLKAENSPYLPLDRAIAILNVALQEGQVWDKTPLAVVRLEKNQGVYEVEVLPRNPPED